MGTIAQEITRIQGAKSDLKTSIENKGVQVPSNALIDDFAGYVDQIQQGGGEENKFMTLTDLSYILSYKNLTDEKVFDGLKRFSQNDITSTLETFSNATIPVGQEALEAIEYVRRILLKKTNSSFRRCFKDACFNLSSFTLDLTDFSPNSHVDMYEMFEKFNIGAAGTGPFINVKIKSDFFTYATDMQFFKGTGKIDLLINENKLYFGTPYQVQFAFGNSSGGRLSFKDYNGNYYTDMYFDLNNQSFLMFGVFENENGMENVYLENAGNVRTYSDAFAKVTTLKSIHNINFDSCDYQVTEQPFGTATNLTNFGDLDIVSGSSLGTFLTTLRLNKIWTVNASALINGQTAGYWFEKFANALGNKTKSSSQTIIINTTLYNSLTAVQKALITDKGYTLSSSS